MSWPPDVSEWDGILRGLPAGSHVTVRSVADAIVQEYLRDVNHGDSEPSPEQVDRWKAWEAIQKRAKTIEALCRMIWKLRAHQLDSDAEWLLRLADELSNVPAKTKARAVLYKPRGRKEWLYSSLIRAWTDAGGPFRVSTGPLARFLCSVVPFELSAEGAKRAIQREKDRREALAVIGTLIGGQSNFSIDEEKVHLIDRFGNRKP